MKTKTTEETLAARKLRKEKRKAKIRAKVRFKLGQIMSQNQETITAIRNRLEILKQNIESLNPRFTPLQPHTKSRWLEELHLAITQLDTLQLAPKMSTEVH